MKTLLLAGLLLGAAPAFAQTSPPPADSEVTGIETLDAKNGFRTYKFGTSISEIPGLKERGKNSYVAPAEPLKIGDSRLFAIYFSAYNGKLASVVLAASGEANSQRLLDALRAQYGNGQQISATRIVWAGAIVTMTYELSESYSTYASQYSSPKLYKSCIVSINSNSALLEQKAEKNAAAKKAAGDL